MLKPLSTLVFKTYKDLDRDCTTSQGNLVHCPKGDSTFLLIASQNFSGFSLRLFIQYPYNLADCLLNLPNFRYIFFFIMSPKVDEGAR